MSEPCKICAGNGAVGVIGVHPATICVCTRSRFAQAQAEVERLTRERDRLRAALEEMVSAGRDAYDNGYPEMERAVCIARAALEGKP